MSFKPNSLIKGLIFAIFDEKLGPTAHSWLPSGMPEDMREKISITVMNITSNMQELPNALAVIPLKEFNVKSIVQFLKFEDEGRRGGTGEAALIMLYEEVNDSIVYRYFKQFDDVFDRHARSATGLLSAKAGENSFHQLIQEFSDELNSLLEILKEEEMSKQSGEAFPSEGDAAKATGEEYRFKMAVCGDPNVGKTSIIIQFTEKAFRRTYLPTIGVNITEKTLNHEGKGVKFVLWDIAGQAKFTKMRKHFYNGSAGVIFVFDLTDETSLNSITAWHTDVKNSIDMPFEGLVLGNKSDLEEKRQISTEKARALVESLGMVYYEVSALTGDNVEEVFHHFAKAFLNEL
ncbi:MAG: Rab family GTPase [Promethearchaeota archaeon]